MISSACDAGFNISIKPSQPVLTPCAYGGVPLDSAVGWGIWLLARVLADVEFNIPSGC
jgi:hypothetical protein